MGEDVGLSGASIEEIEARLVSCSAREAAVKAEEGAGHHPGGNPGVRSG